MRSTAVLYLALVWPALAIEAQTSRIEAVSIKGSSAQIKLETQPGSEYDPAIIERDVRTLYATRHFTDIRVESVDGPAGKSITFRVVEEPEWVLRQVSIRPDEFPLKIALQSGTRINRFRARAAAEELRSKLVEQGHTVTKVEAELKPASTRGEADLILHVNAAEPVRVNQVQLVGNTALPEKEIRGSFQALKARRVFPGIPGIWNGIHLHPQYSEAAVESDRQRVHSLLLSRGYFDASVQAGRTGFSEEARVELAIDSGPRYLVRRWTVTGPGISEVYHPPHGEFRAGTLCQCLFKLRRESEKKGIADFSVRLALQPVARNQVDLVAQVEPGRPYIVRRIDFEGNKKFSDRAIRANLLIDEAEPLNATLLRKSIQRLNRSTLFEPLSERDITILTDPNTGMADVRIRLKERKFGSWLLSGPMGPMSFAGPLHFALASRLPPLRSGLLDLSSWTASFNLIAYGGGLASVLPGASVAPLRAVLALQRPFSPAQGWMSGFTIAPQLGWKGMAFNYAGAQLQGRLLPGLAGKAQLTPALPVTVERSGDSVTLLCESADRWKWVRVGAGLGLQLSAFPLFW